MGGLLRSVLGELFCQTGQVLAYNPIYNATICMACPENCQFCYVDEGNLRCSTCKSGFYINEEKQCRECPTTCDTCYGPTIDKCTSMKSGYIFDSEKFAIVKCPDGCTDCDPSGACSRCIGGYRSEPVKDANSKPVLKYGQELVSCKPCADKECMFCTVDQFGTETCNHCKPEHGPHPYTRQCLKCPIGCVACFSNAMMCNYCHEGYQKNATTGSCDLISTPNCGSFDGDKNECSWCNLGYAVDPNNKKLCASCDIFGRFCTRCGPVALGETPVVPNPRNFKCLTCVRGFVLNSTSGVCDKCPQNCAFCNSDLTCYSCETGYHFNGTACVRNTNEYCDFVANDGNCVSCSAGTFMDYSTHTCKKCDPGCLACDGPGPSDCVACPATQLILNVKEEGFNNLIHRLKMKCVSKCPIDDGLGNPYYVDHFTRSCVANMSQAHVALVDPVIPDKPVPIIEPIIEVPKGKYYFSRRQGDLTATNLFQDSVDYVVDLSKYHSVVIQNSINWAGNNTQAAKEMSQTCFFRGKLYEQISEERETYYECNCMSGFHGIYCNIDDELFDSIQKFKVKFINDLRLAKDISAHYFYEIYKNINTGSMSVDTLTDITNLLYFFCQNHNLTSTQPTEFLSVVDSLIRSHYRQHLEIERDINNKKFDVSAIPILKGMYERLHFIITLAENVLLNSLSYTENFKSAKSTAFQTLYHTPNYDTFRERSKDYFELLPTDLLNLGNSFEPVEFYIVDRDLQTKYAQYNLVAWLYSSLLFSQSNYNGHFASHILSLNIYHKNQRQFFNTSTDADNYLWVKFPLRILPSQESINQDMRCLRIEFHDDTLLHKIQEYPIVSMGAYDNTDSTSGYVICKFRKANFDDVFYSVGYKGEQMDTQTQHITREAMDTGDDYSVASYILPAGVKSSLIGVFSTLLLALSAISVQFL